MRPIITFIAALERVKLSVGIFYSIILAAVTPTGADIRENQGKLSVHDKTRNRLLEYKPRSSIMNALRPHQKLHELIVRG